ncbi:islet cell autoantigen 1 isoform X2 [Cotesia glomerata]|uniref:AH domain-containing protein n=1 Tax=Cotesia glomerata TaxID=32391 RepID=A0AAV7IXC8_COTGL|nr:islet cell autoantigen 1 isoform X2 [Cotesia glomerata]KAH0560350.1 hypothetical protein KQX54_003758 [Cotesia glomerata]
MNTYDNRGGGSGVSGNAFDRWVQRSSNIADDSPITKMQHQYWVTKQALSRKLGKKEDECIVASDAELDAKLELFRSIQESCTHLLRVIDKYQERLCILAQEENAMGRFLKDAGKQDKTRAGKMMSAVGKSLSYSGQQRLTLRGPLVRLYQEVETFRHRAVEDTLETVQSMEKARTEYRAALSWMKNISQELDPDTSKQLERFRKVQTRVRRGKGMFDKEALDCLQKVDLLAAARCNMFSHALVLYQSTLLNFTEKSAQAYSTIANSFKGYQHYDFMVIKELAETSSKLAKETGGDSDNFLNPENNDNKDKLLFFDSDYHDHDHDNSIEQAQEVKADKSEPTKRNNNQQNDEVLLDIGESSGENNSIFESLSLTADTDGNFDGNKKESGNDKELEDFFGMSGYNSGLTNEKQVSELEKSLAELDLAMDSFNEENINFDFDNATSLPSSEISKEKITKEDSVQSLTSENIALLEDILNGGAKANVGWDELMNDTFLPPGILKQSLGDAAMGKKLCKAKGDDKKKKGNQKANSWLDLFAELDPLANNPIESLPRSLDKNAPPV